MTSAPRPDGAGEGGREANSGKNQKNSRNAAAAAVDTPIPRVNAFRLLSVFPSAARRTRGPIQTKRLIFDDIHITPNEQMVERMIDEQAFKSPHEMERGKMNLK